MTFSENRPEAKKQRAPDSPSESGRPSNLPNGFEQNSFKFMPEVPFTEEVKSQKTKLKALINSTF